jgi:3-methyl-2-oxobutanoate hydroxymethyltransferase
VDLGVPVMAHIGLTPQSVHGMGGYRVQGRGAEAAGKLLDQAQAIEKAGAFSVVIEGVPSDVGREITDAVQIPTIGIGAGRGTDAQVLVIHDLLGINETVPKLARKYADLRAEMTSAVRAFLDDVGTGAFPDEEHSYS